MGTSAAPGRGAFSFYRSQLSSQTTLTPAEEHDLALRWRTGDQAAGQKMIEACLPFVMTIALEYRRWGLPLEDIVQEGNIGLLKAAERFDPARGCRLATYAAYWIRAEIREYVARGYRIVRLGSSKSERRALRVYRRTREKNPATLAKLSGLTKERAAELLPLLMARDVSLEGAPTTASPPSTASPPPSKPPRTRRPSATSASSSRRPSARWSRSSPPASAASSTSAGSPTPPSRWKSWASPSASARSASARSKSAQKNACAPASKKSPAPPSPPDR